jgi:UDP-glucose 4-epimerase
MRYFISGGLGFIGLSLVNSLLEVPGTELISVFDRDDHLRLPLAPASPKLRIQLADVRDTPRFMDAIADSDPDVIIHLAAVHYIPWCEKHPELTFNINFIPTQEMVSWINRYRPQRLRHVIFTSSAAVYAPSTRPISETDPISADGPYAQSKLLAELALRRCSAPWTVLRLFNVYGTRDPNPHLIPEVATQLMSGRPALTLGNLDTVRDYVHLLDVCTAIVAVATSAVTGSPNILNVGTGTGTSGHDIVRLLKAYYKSTVPLAISRSQYRTHDKHYLVANNYAIKFHYKWNDIIPITDGIHTVAERSFT